MWNFLKKYNGCDVNKFIDDAKIETKRAKKGDLSKFKLVEQGAAMEFRWKIYYIKVIQYQLNTVKKKYDSKYKMSSLR